MAGAAGGGGGTSLQTSASSSASGKLSGQVDDSGWTVNFGGSNTNQTATGSSAGVPGWIYPTLIIAGVLWLTRNR